MPCSHHPPVALDDHVATGTDKSKKLAPSDHGSAKLSSFAKRSSTETMDENKLGLS